MSICLLCVWLVMVACYRLYLPPSPLLPAHYHCQGQTCTICVLVSVSQCSPGWRPTNTGGRADQPRVQGWWWLGDIWLWYNPGPATASPAQARALSSTYQQTGNWLASWSSPLLASPASLRYNLPGTNQVLSFRQKYSDKDNGQQLATGTLQLLQWLWNMWVEILSTRCWGLCWDDHGLKWKLDGSHHETKHNGHMGQRGGVGQQPPT